MEDILNCNNEKDKDFTLEELTHCEKQQMGKHMAHLISLMNLTEIHLYLITNDCNRYWEQGEYRKEIKKAINPIYKRRKKKTHLQVEHHKISSELVSRKKVCDPMDFRPD